MKHLFRLALLSSLNRKVTTTLSILSIALSVALFLTIEQIRRGAHEGFSGTISQTDLIVGPKTGSIQLLLYSVFHLGSPINNISFSTYERLKKDPAVAWTIPLSLGDSHRGYRVVGTNSDFFEHYRFRGENKIILASGNLSAGTFDVVLGAKVAQSLGYRVGDEIVLSHGISEGESIHDHEDQPFKIVAILEATQTPVDRALYVSLESIEAIHKDWQSGVPPDHNHDHDHNHGEKHDDHEDHDHDHAHDHKPEVKAPKIEQVTAVLLRAKSRVDILRIQRELNEERREPLLAIIPSLSLAELWKSISYVEAALRAISMFVILVGLLGMLIALYTSLNERRREMAILRALGAPQKWIFALIFLESGFLVLSGCALGMAITYALILGFRDLIANQIGIFLSLKAPEGQEGVYIITVILAGLLIGIIPAWKAYRNTLSDGLALRL